MSVLSSKTRFLGQADRSSVLSSRDAFLTKNELIPGRRSFDAAKYSRLTADWTTISYGPNSEIRQALPTLRARSRNLAENNDYGKRFINLLKTNVVGDMGVRMMPNVINPNGTHDEDAEQKLSKAWRKWCRRGMCTVDGRQSFIDVQKLIISCIARDGENLLRFVRGRQTGNEYGFALQLLETDYLDDKYEVVGNDDRKVVMGVEIDRYKRPTAYYITTDHPYEDYRRGQVRHVRVAAGDVLHSYIIDRAGQIRGVPWMHTAMKRLQMLGGYEWAELVASRASAGKMGFYKTPDGSPPGVDDADETGEGDFLQDFDPGTIGLLPPGYEFQGWDPQHPNAAFKDFIKAILRGVASGLNISYNSLANDLEGVNYSSLRQGALDDRDAWRSIQGWFVENIMQPIYEEWLWSALTTGAIQLPPGKIENYLFPHWKCRGWQWVDPLKEVNANVIAKNNGIKSLHDIHSEQGRDIDETFTELQKEQQKAAELDIDINGGNHNAQANTDPEND